MQTSLLDVMKGYLTGSVVHLGQEHPLASNDTDEGRAKNRRTEIVVTRR